MPMQFDADVNKLKEDLLRMGALSERMIHDMIATLVEPGANRLEAVYTNEVEMDRLQTNIDEEVIRLIGVYTPVAGDLRLLMMVFRINAELERIGDKVVNIGHIVEEFLKEQPLKPLIDLSRIADMAEAMLHRSLDAFVNRSLNDAVALIDADDAVDNLSDQMFRVLFTRMLDDPRSMGRILGLMLTVQAFERIADHAVNIAEDVVYMVRGKDIRHSEDGGKAAAPGAEKT